MDSGREIQTKMLRMGSLEVSRLTNNHAIYSDPSITWVMLHKIDEMYRDLTHQENLNLRISHIGYMRTVLYSQALARESMIKINTNK